MNELVLKEYGPEKYRVFRYDLVNIDNFSKYGWTVPLKNKNTQTIKDSFENIIIGSKRSPNLLEGDPDRGFFIRIFQSFLNNNNIELFPRNSSFGSVFAEIFNRTFRDLLKKAVFEKGQSNWINVLSTITK